MEITSKNLENVSFTWTLFSFLVLKHQGEEFELDLREKKER